MEINSDHTSTAYELRLPQRIEIFEYSKEKFISLAATMSECSEDHHQLKEVASYLEDRKATTMVFELYIDRHYLDEHKFYHSTRLDPPGHVTARLHFFDNDVSETLLPDAKTLLFSSKKKRRKIEYSYSKAYIGFTVIRPSLTPIGRTLFTNKTIEYLPKCRCHLLGIELTFRASAFSQQDSTVSSCATTSAWSALYHWCRREGYRTPTPYTVARRATEHSHELGRQFPSPGLTSGQLAASLVANGFPPLILDVEHKRAQETATIVSIYTRSGIPVILLLKKPGEKNRVGHAVIAYATDAPSLRYPKQQSDSLGTSGSDKKATKKCQTTQPRLIPGDCRQFTVHDDRLGPYIDVEFDPKKPFVQLTRVGDDSPKIDETHTERTSRVDCEIDTDSNSAKDEAGKFGIWQIHTIHVPLYPKIRATAYELIQMAKAAVEYLPEKLGIDLNPCSVDIFYCHSGSYFRKHFPQDINQREIVFFLTQSFFSRYIAVTRFFEGSDWQVDLLWDVTHKLSDDDNMNDWAVVGLLTSSDIDRDKVYALAQIWKCPFI